MLQYVSKIGKIAKSLLEMSQCPFYESNRIIIQIIQYVYFHGINYAKMACECVKSAIRDRSIWDPDPTLLPPVYWRTLLSNTSHTVTMMGTPIGQRYAHFQSLLNSHVCNLLRDASVYIGEVQESEHRQLSSIRDEELFAHDMERHFSLQATDSTRGTFTCRPFDVEESLD